MYGPKPSSGAWPLSFAFISGKSCVADHEISFFCAATASALLNSLFVTTAPTRCHSPSPARAHTDSQLRSRLPLLWITKKFSHCFSKSFLPPLTNAFFVLAGAAPKPALRATPWRRDCCGGTSAEAPMINAARASIVQDLLIVASSLLAAAACCPTRLKRRRRRRRTAYDEES